jgi:hypothetical protein
MNVIKHSSLIIALPEINVANAKLRHVALPLRVAYYERGIVNTRFTHLLR